VFRVAEVGKTNEEGFKWCATGPGYVFRQPILIKNLDWFPEVLRVTGNFRFGVTGAEDHAVIAGLSGIAEKVGHRLS
jgi:hypothetical protein